MKFTPVSSGNYAIGIHGTSIANQDYIAIDNFTIEMAPTTSVKELNPIDFNIYPNPNDGSFTIYNGTSYSVDLKIFNNQGQLIKAIKNINGLSNKFIDLNDVAKGIYTLNITDGKSVKTKRITVK
jgi:hypothetical protein